MTPLDRVFLLATGLLAAYQVAVGIDGLSTIPIIAYTIAFGVLLIASLLLLILGFEVLESPVVAIVSTIIPLSISLGSSGSTCRLADRLLDLRHPGFSGGSRHPHPPHSENNPDQPCWHSFTAWQG